MKASINTIGLDLSDRKVAVCIINAEGAILAQEIYQRLFSARSVNACRNGAFLSAALFVIMAFIPITIAPGAAQLHPELMGSDYGQKLIPSMVTQYAGLPIQILFFGALISAIMSTSSGAMLAPATIIGENLLKPYIPGISDKRLLIMTRISVIVVAAISYYFALSDNSIVGLVVASLSILLVCIVAPFTFGLFWKRASVFGAWSSIVVGGVVWLACYFLKTQLDPTMYGLASSCLAMVAGSLLRPDSVRPLP